MPHLVAVELAVSDREHRVRVWTSGGHVITGSVRDVEAAEGLEAELEKLGRNVRGPVAHTGLIAIPQAEGRAVQVVLDAIEAWSIEPDRIGGTS